jgi:hypothetical protein
MVVAISVLVYLVFCFIFAGENFFMAMILLAMLFAAVEILWWLYFGDTLSAKYWKWRGGQVGWKRNVAPIAMAFLAIYLAGHLLGVLP